VIAWGQIKDPAATKHGQEIGVISAYDGHKVDVGRVAADSTWHHWFDINLTGIAAPPSPYAGFDATAAGLAALTQIDAYFLNCGVWLAPPAQQAAMRHFGWWDVLWSDRVAELGVDAPLWVYGEEAIDALGRRASRCTVSHWVFDWPIYKEKIPWWEWPQVRDRFELIDLPIERFLAGGILRNLIKELGPQSQKRGFPDRAPEDKELEKVISAGVEHGLKEFADQLNKETKLAAQLISSHFGRKALK